MPQRLPKLDKDELKDIVRKHAAHEDIPFCEYFPFALVKFNPSYSTIPVDQIDPTKERFKRIYPILRRQEEFELKPPCRLDDFEDELVRWDHPPQRYIISKKLYQLRAKLQIEDKWFLQEFLEDEPDGRRLFYRLKELIHEFVDVTDAAAALVALWVMATHIHTVFSAFPYCYIWAEMGSGKSRLIKIAYLTAHMGELVTDPTAATVARGVELTSCTLCIDEAESINKKDAPQLTATINSGYEKGPKVPRYDTELKEIIYSSPYSPKIIGSIGGPTPTIESRSLRVPLQRTADQLKFANQEPLDQDMRKPFDKIHQQLVIWGIDVGCEIAAMDRQAVGRKYNRYLSEAPARLSQIMLPILCLFEHLGLEEDKAELANLREIIEFQAEEKKASTVPDDDARILVAAFRSADSFQEKVTMASIIEWMGLETKEEQKHFNDRKVGRVLQKYMVPKKLVNARTEYWPGRSRDDRVAFMQDIFRRYRLEVTAVEEKAERQGAAGADEERPGPLEGYGGEL